MDGILEFPCLHGPWTLNQAKYHELKVRFPTIDIITSLRKMIWWIEQNSARLQAPSNMDGFIDKWLANDLVYANKLPSNPGHLRAATQKARLGPAREPFRKVFSAAGKSKREYFEEIECELRELDVHLEQIELSWQNKADVSDGMWQKVGTERSLVIHLRKLFRSWKEKQP